MLAFERFANPNNIDKRYSTLYLTKLKQKRRAYGIYPLSLAKPPQPLSYQQPMAKPIP